MLAQMEQSEGSRQEVNQHTEENDENFTREQALNERSIVVVLNQDDREERCDVFSARGQVVKANFSVHERSVNRRIQHQSVKIELTSCQD